MDIDWEVEIGGDAPVIEAQWPGLIDLRMHPERINEISELNSMPPLRDLLLALNSEKSPVWTSKCDVWEPYANAGACYIDILPREPQLFTDWKELQRFCQELVRRLAPKAEYVPLRSPDVSCAFIPADDGAEGTNISLVIRKAVNNGEEGFGVTAYFAAEDSQAGSAKSALGVLMGTFLEAVMATRFPRTCDQS
jgi:hypothetical protein